MQIASFENGLISLMTCLWLIKCRALCLGELEVKRLMRLDFLWFIVQKTN